MTEDCTLIVCSIAEGVSRLEDALATGHNELVDFSRNLFQKMDYNSFYSNAFSVRLQEHSMMVQKTLEALQNNVLMLIYSGNANSSIVSSLDDFSQFIIHQQKDVTDEKSFDSPYTKYSLYIDALHDAVSLLFVAYLVLQQQIPVEQMAEVLFEKLREQEIVFDFGETPNWIPVNKALCKLHATKEKYLNMRKGREEERWLYPSEINDVINNLSSIQVAIFNSPNIRRWDQVISVSNDSIKEVPELHENFTHLTALSSKVYWRNFDVDLDPFYLAPNDFNQHSFRNILKRFLPGIEMVEILGDGNCFYRSLIKFIWVDCPIELQEEFSMVMRKLLNPLKNQENDPFTAFQVEGESDAKTMRQSGKWADHVQNLKASAYLDRPIFLIRFDDPAIKLVNTRCGALLVPGQDYCIRHFLGEHPNQNDIAIDEGDPNKTPLTLYYIPEAHYEIVRTTLKKETTSDMEVEGHSQEERLHYKMQEILLSIATANYQECSLADELVSTLFEVHQEVGTIREMFLVCGSNEDLRETLLVDFSGVVERFKQLMSQFLICLQSLSDDFKNHLGQNYKFHAKVLRQLSKEAPHALTVLEQIGSSDDNTKPGTGILGQILARVVFYVSKSITGPYISYEEFNKINYTTGTGSLRSSLNNVPNNPHTTTTTTTASTCTSGNIENRWGVSSAPVTSTPFVSAFASTSKPSPEVNKVAKATPAPTTNTQPTTTTATTLPIGGRYRRQEEEEYKVVRYK